MVPCAARPAWRDAHVARLHREREARVIAREYRQAQRDAEPPKKRCAGCCQALPVDAFPALRSGKRRGRCRPCHNEYQRRAYHKKHGRSGAGATRAEHRRKVAEGLRQAATERAAYLGAVLKGAIPAERISDTEAWDRITAEMRKLWHLSGQKPCIACEALVPPAAMLPPGPGNFYEGQCNRCASASYEASRRATFGPPQGPPQITLRDGSRITVAELARRHRERQRGRRITRFDRHWR